MTAKDFLQQAFVAHKEIEVQLERLTTWQALATRTTTVIRTAPGGNHAFGSRIENAVIKMQELTDSLANEVVRLIEVTKKISAAIAQVPNPNERAVLEFRYLCFFSWPQIAAVMKMGNTTIFRLHRSALKNFRTVAVNGSKRQ